MEREPLTYEKLSQVIGDLMYGPPWIDNTGTPIFLDDVVMEEPVSDKPGYVNLRSKHINVFNVKKSDWDKALMDNAESFIKSNP